MRLFFAGMEGSLEAISLVKAGLVENAFFSYYYMRASEKQTNYMHTLKPKLVGVSIVDSGAHSFFSEAAGGQMGLSASVHKKKQKTKETPQVYFEEYVKWLKANWTGFDYFVELDIGEIVGQKKVLMWREILKLEGLYSKCITVYHPSVMTWDDYIASLDDSQSLYMALEGARGGSLAVDYPLAIQEALKRNVRLHGFAMTKRDVLFRYPLYSVDSSSWKSGVQYGAGLAIKADGEAGGTRYRDVKSMSDMPLADGLEDVFSAIPIRQRNKRCELAIRGYNLMAEQATDYWKARGITYAN